MTENWDLRAFIFSCPGDQLEDDEKERCYAALNKGGFSAASKRRAFFALDEPNLERLGIEPFSVRKALLLVIAGRAQSDAGSSGQSGPGGASGGGAGGAGPDAAFQLADLSRSNVWRLVDKGETVGTCCLVSHNNRRFVLAARHCMDPKPGQRIDVSSFTVCGHKLRHLASFLKHDVTVLLLDDNIELPDLLRGAIPFEVDAGIGLFRGMPVTLIGFPLAADKTITGFQQSGIPLVAKGDVSWISSKNAFEAIGSYPGTFPNCSGGAVANGRYLAGLHTGIMWHEKGTNPRDTSTTTDQEKGDASGSTCGSGAAGGAGGAAAAVGGEPIETDKWLADDGAAGAQASACGANKKRKPASRQEDAASMASALKYCLDNVEHKQCMGVFVPAHVLGQLLDCCHELLLAAVRPAGAPQQQ
ncbi:hypothetical protein HXX76_002738 [Chlamydomonas incerta]|uniref:Peptidase S1 domain-containing protein n=1 Tax=Chlamydomonas incerta TaxID=51695 RepID=A0A835TLB0_CHLIN|nr:hypothetical protein HXX76_002738 [Chlamydomonas incerta]|eukprot:KAG2442654.1 hypothetical protein HXX76_002738 [Chlamydomonas incerta]